MSESFTLYLGTLDLSLNFCEVCSCTTTTREFLFERLGYKQAEPITERWASSSRACERLGWPRRCGLHPVQERQGLAGYKNFRRHSNSQLSEGLLNTLVSFTIGGTVSPIEYENYLSRDWVL